MSEDGKVKERLCARIYKASDEIHGEQCTRNGTRKVMEDQSLGQNSGLEKNKGDENVL